MKRRRWQFLLVLMLLFMLSGCKNNTLSKQEVADEKVVTTFYPMYDFAKNIMGSTKNLKLLIPAGVEPHD
ncbi:MAG: zinc ABC transporter substrate-binding protein, partial [Streptococcaceae bacterium]|nr:zinc ABC transporter substrate-binding protein [Streptococcaceae bacterium]